MPKNLTPLAIKAAIAICGNPKDRVVMRIARTIDQEVGTNELLALIRDLSAFIENESDENRRDKFFQLRERWRNVLSQTRKERGDARKRQRPS